MFLRLGRSFATEVPVANEFREVLIHGKAENCFRLFVSLSELFIQLRCLYVHCLSSYFVFGTGL